MAEKRVLITGGAGFIGSHLCDRYLKEGWDVISLDNYFTGSLRNIEHLLKNDRFQAVDHDVVNPYSAEVDLILNFACPASPVHYQDNPIKTSLTNFMGTKNFLDLAEERKIPFFQASTSEVYGDPLEHPQKESYWGNVNPHGIRSCYDEGKRVAETLCFDYHRERNVPIHVIRIFNTYGPRMAANDGRVISNFIVQALRGEDISIFGDGTQTRSFCYVDDLVEGIYQYSTTMDEPGPLNLGNDGEFTISELADLVLKITGSTSNLIFKELPGDDPKRRKPDLTKTKAAIDWEPRVPLAEGLKHTIDYFRKLL